MGISIELIYSGWGENETAKKKYLFLTSFAYPLDKHIHFLRPVAFGQPDEWDFDVQTIRLSTTETFKVYVVVVVNRGLAGLVAKRVLQTAFIVKDLVDKSTIEKSF